jgi:hypothetical protein
MFFSLFPICSSPAFDAGKTVESGKLGLKRPAYPGQMGRSSFPTKMPGILRHSPAQNLNTKEKSKGHKHTREAAGERERLHLPWSGRARRGIPGELSTCPCLSKPVSSMRQRHAAGRGVGGGRRWDVWGRWFLCTWRIHPWTHPAYA